MGRTATTQPSETARKSFTVESAQATLVLLQRIVGDIVETYAELMRLRSEVQELSTETGHEARLAELKTRIDGLLEKLNRLHKEIKDIGCELKDFSTGLVDFPATYRGRRVWLCWKLGEPAVTHWHEWDAGFAGRRQIDESFAAALRDAAKEGDAHP